MEVNELARQMNDATSSVADDFLPPSLKICVKTEELDPEISLELIRYVSSYSDLNNAALGSYL